MGLKGQKKNRKHYSKEFIQNFLQDWKKSGKSIYPFAKEKGVCGQTALRWSKGFKPTSRSGFVKMLIPKDLSLNSFGNNFIIEKGDMKVYVPLHIDGESLQTILNTLRSIE